MKRCSVYFENDFVLINSLNNVALATSRKKTEIRLVPAALEHHRIKPCEKAGRKKNVAIIHACVYRWPLFNIVL